ncbi:hypothetical protein [Geothermobacter hydrogeniphilus]|uniref:Uncharacterized protein n=1 Tax=Geothermobacter hydrogeniphilus TaxID=1969733 RepID=A0A1X0YA78_9BACT|nr:hypothetical protein [Geothermobacter hydrogeniphilus]ORJ62085.1 hypothetical protein B5V00_04860 [Geothermobacter hydrogeniphilus]
MEKQAIKRSVHGVAGLYSRNELKKILSGYLLLMAVVEGFIFFVCWISYLSRGQMVFPWKAYILASFITPVAITFLLGVIVYGFNRYLFARDETFPAAGTVSDAERQPNRFDEVMRSLRQVPFLVALLLLVLAGGIIYKLDAIVGYVADAGAQAANYLFILLAVVLGVAALVSLVWMVLSYRLRCRRLDLLHKYRMEMLEQTGMVLLEDETVIDREGRVVEYPAGAGTRPSRRGDDLAVLPALPGRKRDEEN